MFKKIGLTALYLGIAYLIYLYGESILAWFETDHQLPLVMIMATLMALFPVIPYPIVGGVIGVAYGPIIGGVVTWVGSVSASLLMFLFVRYGYQDWGVKILHKYKGLDKVTTLFEKNAFLMILFARLIPIIPSIFVNVYAALSRVSFSAYAIASSVGKIPAMFLFALVGDHLVTGPRMAILTITVYGVFLTVTLYLYRLWERKSIKQILKKSS